MSTMKTTMTMSSRTRTRTRNKRKRTIEKEILIQSDRRPQPGFSDHFQCLSFGGNLGLDGGVGEKEGGFESHFRL